MTGDADIAGVAAVIGEPARATLLLALMDREPLPACDLAGRAGISPSTASGHLGKLVAAGLLVDERRGRHRYFRLARVEVAEAVEALAAIAPEKPVSSLREATVADALRFARTCYDHLAGRLGVELTVALEGEQLLIRRNMTYELGHGAPARLADLGIDLRALERQRRTLARPCLDWSERRPHVAGALGAAVAASLFERGWLRRRPSNRSVEVTPVGLAGLRAEFGVSVAPQARG